MGKKEVSDLKDWTIQPGEISMNAVRGKELCASFTSLGQICIRGRDGCAYFNKWEQAMRHIYLVGRKNVSEGCIATVESFVAAEQAALDAVKSICATLQERFDEVSTQYAQAVKSRKEGD